MIAIILTILLATTEPSTAAVSSSCTGADPAIVSAVSRPGTASSVNTFTIAVTVRNLGSKKQTSDVLQYVAMYQNDVKIDTHGIRPLAPGQSQTVTFSVQRAADTEANSTNLRFALGFRKPVPPGAMDCNPNNDTYRLSV